MTRKRTRPRTSEAWIDDPDWNAATRAHLRQPFTEYLEGVACCRQNGIPIETLRPEAFGLPPRLRQVLTDRIAAPKTAATEAPTNPVPADPDAAATPAAETPPQPRPTTPGAPPAPGGPGNWRDPWLGKPVVKVLAAVAPAAVAWLSPGRLAAGKLTLLEGDPGLGKSTLLCDWAARITTGEPLPGGEPRPPRGVLLLSAEDGLADTIRPRLEAAGADLTKVVALEEIDDQGELRPPAIPADAPLLGRLAREIDAALIVLDPLVAFLDPALSAHRDQDVRRALAPLKTLGEETGAAVLAVRHLTKGTGGSALYRGGGSIGIIGAARFALLLARDPDDVEQRILANQKANLARPAPSLRFALEPVPNTDIARVAWLGEAEWTARDLLAANDAAERADPEERSALEEAVEWLRAELAAGPRPTKSVEGAAAEAGVSQRTIVRARRRLGVVATRVGSGGGSRFVLSLPPSDGGRSAATAGPGSAGSGEERRATGGTNGA
jgi:hypothetical protein